MEEEEEGEGEIETDRKTNRGETRESRGRLKKTRSNQSNIKGRTEALAKSFLGRNDREGQGRRR